MPSQSWGNSVGSGSGSTLTLLYDGVEVSGGNARITNPRIQFYSKSGWSDSSNSITAQGSAVDDVQVHSGTLNGGTREWSVAGTWTPIAYGSTTWVRFEAKVVGISFFNGDAATSYYSIDVELPARAYSLPLAPLNFAGARVSDSRVDLSWQGNYTSGSGAYPWTGLRLDRWDNVSNVWTRIANLNWDVTSYSDTTTQPNRQYAYALWAYNPTGDSPAVHVHSLYTTPAAPTIGAPEKLANGSINVRFTNNSGYASAVEVQDSPDGTTWTSLTSTAPVSSPYNHASPSTSVSHRYRVRVKSPSGLWSAWSATSSVVQLQAPPNAPTNVQPTVSAIGDALVVTWQHNPTDGSPQRAYTLRHRLAGGSWTTVGQTLSAVSSHTISAATYPSAATVEVEVATWGAHATVGPWSATQAIKRTSRPTVGISSPASGTTLAGSTLTLDATYFQAEGTPIASWKATLRKAGQQVAVANGNSSTPLIGIVFPSLQDATTYTVDLEATSADGLTSAVTTATYPVDFAEPDAPTVVVSFEREAGTATIRVTNPATGPEVVSNEIYGNGTYLGSVPANGSLTWRTVPLNGASMFARALTALPSSADSAATPVPYGDEERGIHLNAGVGYVLHAALWGGSPEISETVGGEEYLTTYEGDRQPSVTFGSEESLVLDVSALCWYAYPDSDPVYWRAIRRARTNVCYRDAKRTLYGVLRKLDLKESSTLFGTLSFGFEETLSDASDLYTYTPQLIEDPPGSGQYRIVRVANDDSVEGLLP